MPPRPGIHTPRGLGHSEPSPPTCHANESSHCLCPGHIEIPEISPFSPAYLPYFRFSLRDGILPSSWGPRRGDWFWRCAPSLYAQQSLNRPAAPHVLADSRQRRPPLPRGPPGLLPSSCACCPLLCRTPSCHFLPAKAGQPGSCPSGGNKQGPQESRKVQGGWPRRTYPRCRPSCPVLKGSRLRAQLAQRPRMTKGWAGSQE